MTKATILYLLTMAIFISVAMAKRQDFEDAVKAHKLKNEKRKKKEKDDKNVKKKALWEADLYDDINYDDDDALKSMLGSVEVSENAPVATEGDDVDIDESQQNDSNGENRRKRLLQSVIPINKDLRTDYPNCISVSNIRNQSACGSCWAFSAATVASDQYCIQKKINRSFSANDLLTCCANCAAVRGNGCQGGYLNRAFDYMKATGLTTGEAFGDTTQCKPYFLSPKPTAMGVAPACTSSCAVSSISNEKIKIASYKTISGESAMINEIATRGSLSSAFIVYKDFYLYRSGIYKSDMLTAYGGHAIKIIGYGVDAITKTKFWIIANSWGTGWGEKGFFRMVRGENNCNLERFTSFSVTFA
jgi:cathepsin B